MAVGDGEGGGGRIGRLCARASGQAMTTGSSSRRDSPHDDPPARLVPTAWPALLAGTAFLLYALLVLHFDFICDDAYIAFRYARNLAEGRGLVFNAGESPPVEGYTNLLWVLWLALIERAGLDQGLGARLTALACGLGLLALFLRACAAWGISRGARACALLVLAGFPPLAVWTTGGLEPVAFTLACFGCFVLLSGDLSGRRAWAAGLVGLVAALLRAEGILWVVVVAVAAALGERARTRAWLRGAALAGAIVAVGVVLNVVWRLDYHEDWLPNTARLKAGASWMRLERGALYLASHVLELPVLALVPLLVLAARGGSRPRLALQASLVLAFCAFYSLWVGGDFMAMGRFLVPAAPFLGLLAAVWSEHALRTRRGALVAGATAAFVALGLLASFDRMPIPQRWRQALHFRWNDESAISEAAMWRGMRARSREWVQVGRALARIERPGESIVLANIGAIGFHTRLFVHDVCGLVSPEVARSSRPPMRASASHDKRVGGEFFLPRKPTYLGAWLERPSAPLGAPPPAALRLERHPLPPEQGFPPDRELRVLRFHWED